MILGGSLATRWRHVILSILTVETVAGRSHVVVLTTQHPFSVKIGIVIATLIIGNTLLQKLRISLQWWQPISTYICFSCRPDWCSLFKTLHLKGNVHFSNNMPINASILYQNEEIYLTTYMWKFQLILLCDYKKIEKNNSRCIFFKFVNFLNTFTFSRKIQHFIWGR